MTHIDPYKALNDTLKHTCFLSEEIADIETTKNYIKQRIPFWAHNHFALVVAGGCFVSHLQNELIKDIDIFVLDNCRDEVKNEIRDEMFRTYGIKIENKTDSYNRNNANISEVWTTKDKFIQVIFTKHKTRNELINDFDYVHCQVSYWGDRLYITRKTYDAIKNRQLIPNNTNNIQQWREEKFLNRGYKKMYETKQSSPWTIRPSDGLIDVTSGPVVGASSSWGPYRTNIAKNV